MCHYYESERTRLKDSDSLCLILRFLCRNADSTGFQQYSLFIQNIYVALLIARIFSKHELLLLRTCQERRLDQFLYASQRLLGLKPSLVVRRFKSKHGSLVFGALRNIEK